MRILACLILLLVPSTALADEEPASGPWFSAHVQVSPLHGGASWWLGLAGGWESQRGLRIGGAVFDLLDGPAALGVSTKLHIFGAVVGQRLALGAFGITPEVLLGVGDVSAYREVKADDYGRSWFFVAQPSVGLDLPPLGPLRLRLGAGYRFVTGAAPASPFAQLTTELKL